MAKRTILNKRNRPMLKGFNEANLENMLFELGKTKGKEGVIDLVISLVKGYEEVNPWGDPELRLQELEEKLKLRRKLYNALENVKSRSAFYDALAEVEKWCEEEQITDENRKFSEFCRYVAVEEDGERKVYCDGSWINRVHCSRSTLYKAFCEYNRGKRCEKIVVGTDLGLSYYSLEELERFAFMVSVAFLNDELCSLLYGYLDDVTRKEPKHRKRNSLSERAIFRDIPSLNKCMRQMENVKDGS